jgi:hypothetical protein
VDGGGGYDRGQGVYGGQDGSFSGGSFAGSATGGKGWGGLLKSVTKTATTLGKKGLKAAQVGGCVCSNVGCCVSVCSGCLPASHASMIQLMSLHGLQAGTNMCRRTLKWVVGFLKLCVSRAVLCCAVRNAGCAAC